MINLYVKFRIEKSCFVSTFVGQCKLTRLHYLALFFVQMFGQKRANHFFPKRYQKNLAIGPRQRGKK